jgi:teichoic acid transport system ATP-binding protein
LCTFPEPSLLGVNAVLMSELTSERNIMIGGLAAYPSGMGACLRFAISSAATQDVVLIDEALATGDAEFKAKSKDRIDRIRRQAGTIFLVSHSLATIEGMCARALWIDEGRLRTDGPAADVCTAYRSATKR